MIWKLIAINPARMALMLGCLMLAGLAEGIGFISLLPILGIATGEGLRDDSMIGRAVGYALDVLGLGPDLGPLLAIVILAVVAKSILTLVAARNVGYAAADFATEMRLALIRSLMAARWDHFVMQPVGRLSNAMGIEASQSAASYNALANLLACGIQAAVFSLVALLTSWQVAAIGLLAGVAMIVLLQKLVGVARRAGKRQVGFMNALIIRITDGLQLIKPLKAMGQEHRLAPLLEAEARDINAAQRQMMLSTAALSAFQEPVLTVFLAAGVFVALSFTSYPLADLLFMAILFQRIAVRTGGLQVQYQKVAGFEAAYWSIRDAIDGATAARETVNAGGKAPRLDQAIRFENVSFAYDTDRVLHDVSVEIPARRLTAVVGPSGVGKTTLVDLVIGLITPQSGRVVIDGEPLGALDQRQWRQSIGYVPQDLVLFHDTIAANVILGDPEITPGDAEEALRAAGAWDFVSALADGVGTVVGERGARLSGGQRQRIAIARALVRKPVLLILDEPTTALDPATEQAICQTLRDLTARTTMLAISHQRAIVGAADVVYELADGRVRDMIVRDDPAPVRDVAGTQA